MLKNGFYNAGGALARIGIGLLAVPLLIRLIGVEEYGLWILVSAAVGVLGIAEAGLSVSTTFFLSRDLAENDVAGVSQTLTVTLGGMVILASAAALLLWLGANWWVGFFPNIDAAQRSIAVKAFQVGALVIWARLVQQILVSVEQAFQRYGIINILNTLQSILGNLGLVAVAWVGGRTYSLMQWQAVTTIVMLMVHLSVGWFLLRHLKPGPSWNRTKSLSVARYSLLTWVGTLGGMMFNQGDRLIVGALLGTAVLGVYGAITNVTVQINGLSALLVQPLLPIVSRLTAKRDGDLRLVQERVKESFRLNALAALGMGGAMLTCAWVVMRLLLPGQVPDEYVLAFRAATVIYALYSLNAVGYYILLGTSRVKALTIISFAGGSLSLLMIALGTAAFGFMGAILGNAGFLLTWLMIWIGMNQVRLDVPTWSRWAAFPVVWFFLVALFALILPDRFEVAVLVVILQTAVLFGWFLATQEPIRRRVKHRVAWLSSMLLAWRSM